MRWSPLQVCRVLRGGGIGILSFSSNFYAEKAVAGWIQRSMPARAQLVASSLTAAGFVDAEIVSDATDVAARSQPPQGNLFACATVLFASLS